MLVFATSDKGGTGRSVTSANLLYRLALRGRDVCYVDFDFGSPTAGSIFQVYELTSGSRSGNGLHSYVTGSAATPERTDLWQASERRSLRVRPPAAGQLVLLPGDEGGGEFPVTDMAVQRCLQLFLRMDEEFDCTVVDLSAGRSYAAALALAATAAPQARGLSSRWLIFHRWTSQHIVAASKLVRGDHGIIRAGVDYGHERSELAASIRFVRTATVAPDSTEMAGLRVEQVAFLRACDQDLHEMAAQLRVGRSQLLGQVPFDPLLQWREQIITDEDVYTRRIANVQTVEAFEHLAGAVIDDQAWEVL